MAVENSNHSDRFTYVGRSPDRLDAKSKVTGYTRKSSARFAKENRGTAKH